MLKKFSLILIIIISFLAGSFLLPLKTDVQLPPAIAYTPAELSKSSDEQKNIDVYKNAAPGVVYISTVVLTVDPFDMFSHYKQQEGSGSGVIIDSVQGIVLTNLHVIQDAAKISILVKDGQSYSAKLLGFDAEYDLAVLRFKEIPENLVEVPFGDSAKLEVGQNVLAIGNPFGLNKTLTTGIISSLDRTIRRADGDLFKGLIQTDAAINPGNSGGPLLDTSGQLIGLNTAILSQSGDSAGIGFAVPVNKIKKVLPELIATGKILRPYIGWLVSDTNQGPMIRRVQKDSPAEKAGVVPIERFVRQGFLQGFIRNYDEADIIISVNGIPVSNQEEIEDLVIESEKNIEFEFVLRKGNRQGPERKVLIKPDLK